MQERGTTIMEDSYSPLQRPSGADMAADILIRASYLS
jgi:hypothetical protein